MATVKTHDLIKCNKLYETLPSIRQAGIYPYNGSIIRFDNDINKNYRVRKNVQCRFRDGEVPFLPEESDFYPNGTRVKFSFTSMKFNGVEYITSPIDTVMLAGDVIWTDFPNFVPGDEYEYNGSGIANGIIVDSVGSKPIGVDYSGANNFYLFFKWMVDSFSIPIDVAKSPRFYFDPEFYNVAYTWYPTPYPGLDNIILEKYYDDNFEYEYTETIVDLSDNSEESTVHKFIWDGESASYFRNGSDQTNVETVQPADVFSFFSYGYEYDTIEEINSCPIYEPFNASIQDDTCSGVAVNCDCTKITFEDNSNYDSNGLPGHDGELFNSRIITITKPNGGTYVYATSDYEGADEVIPPYYDSNNTFVYNFQQGDVDGIYEIEVCAYPDWNGAVTYELFIGAIVKRNGKLYKVIATNTNADPSIPANSTYWVEYSCDGNCNETRYCSKEKIVVLCLSLLKCYKTLVKQAFCGIDTNPCKPICDNKQFMNAMKFKVVMDELEFSVCSKDWASAQAQIDILNSLCCCNG
jgi:hypothetical protein